MSNFLALSWSISKGAETYGYNICRLDDNNSGKRYRTIGGGYDMVGTVVADWLQDAHQEALVGLAGTLESKPYAGTTKAFPKFYGMFQHEDGHVSLDGGCGLECIRKIAGAIGVSWTQAMNRRGRKVIGFAVTVTE